MAKTNQTKQAAASTGGADPGAGNVDVNDTGAGTELTQEGAQESALKQLEDVASPPTTAQKLVRARVLAFCGLGVPNDVIEIDEEVAATMPGIVDVTPEAVAYAQSIAE